MMYLIFCEGYQVGDESVSVKSFTVGIVGVGAG